MDKLEKLIKSYLTEMVEENYMFFSNIEQISRQTQYLNEFDKEKIDLILKEHDWAKDHISEAKSLIDQVFDFLMNELKTERSTINEGKNKPTNPKLWAQSLAWAKRRYKVCPSAYCNGAAAKRYKSKGGGWKKN